VRPLPDRHRVGVVDDSGRCRQIDTITAVCDVATSLTIHLGEGTNSYWSASDVPATIHGGSGVDTITAGSGRDEVFAAGGVDVIRGGAGDDLLYGEGLGDTIEGQAGNDTIGGFESDRAYGGPGDDDFHEHNGFMHFCNAAGNDTVDAGTGAGRTDQRVDGGAVCRGSGVSSWPGCER
jgi:Ca2+-binding RTX toxin-like protein